MKMKMKTALAVIAYAGAFALIGEVASAGFIRPFRFK